VRGEKDKITMDEDTLSAEEIVRKASEKDEWCLGVFFSADIEGATAYKTTMRTLDSEEDWCYLFETFYREFPNTFKGEYQDLSKQHATIKIPDPLKPVVWKYGGDEILLYAPLTDYGQILEHLRAFYQSIINYNQVLIDRNITVRCKGTAWLAGFPVNNRIISFQSIEKGGSTVIDFIGSSIDCGFRLTKFATSQKLVVSLDLLWMFAEALTKYKNAKHFASLQDIYYEGKFALKGVWSGTPYPVFWIDALTTRPIEEKWVTKVEKCAIGDIIEFCEKINDSMSSSDFIRPFIKSDHPHPFDKIPEGFEEKRQRIISYKKKLLSLPPDTAVMDDNNPHECSKITPELIDKKLEKFDG